jgi:hypothetical protein
MTSDPYVELTYAQVEEIKYRLTFLGQGWESVRSFFVPAAGDVGPPAPGEGDDLPNPEMETEC